MDASAGHRAAVLGEKEEEVCGLAEHREGEVMKTGARDVFTTETVNQGSDAGDGAEDLAA